MTEFSQLGPFGQFVVSSQAHSPSPNRGRPETYGKSATGENDLNRLIIDGDEISRTPMRFSSVGWQRTQPGQPSLYRYRSMVGFPPTAGRASPPRPTPTAGQISALSDT